MRKETSASLIHYLARCQMFSFCGLLPSSQETVDHVARVFQGWEDAYSEEFEVTRSPIVIQLFRTIAREISWVGLSENRKVVS